VNRRQPLAAVLSLLVMLALVAPLAANWPPQTAAATGRSQLSISDPSSNGLLPIHPIAQTIWDAADGPVARMEVARGWLLGPAPLAMTLERYDDSPTGARQLVYFDKGRLDILDVNASTSNYWAAPGGQLVTELLSGAIQLGANEWVQRKPAEIPVVGDPDQPDAVTYATLGDLATQPHALRVAGTTPPTADASVGDAITTMLGADGSIDADGYSGADVRVGSYDEVTDHNIAAPFQTWGETQVYEWLYVLGHPLTEPYWVDTVVGGVEERVLVQAFERRVLSYTPDNPADWQTESGNVGQHYRAWRGLTQPADPTLSPLVAGVPFGEELVAAAQAAGIDPYLLASVSEVSSAGDPFQETGGRRGLLGVRAEIAPTNDDPTSNALVGAQELSRLLAETGDERAALAAYHGGTSDPSSTFADSVLVTRDALRNRQASPADVSGVAQPLVQVSSGVASAFTGGYDAGWWSRHLTWTASWGGAVPGWATDPLGYYCVAPGYAAGDRLRLVANSLSIDCTVGGEAGDPGVPSVGDSVVALNTASFDALGLHGNNSVRVFHLGPASGQRTASASQINGGAAAFYASGYDVAWWERTMYLYEGWGNAVSGWSVDPNGFYCVHPGYKVGQRLRLVANGVTLDCTIGDTVQAQHLALWQSRWAIEMSWDTYAALGLPGSNSVEVFAL
jgi:hypothetical protein